MDFQIREAITANLKGNSTTDIREVVEDAIQRGEEHLLPGLGVIFEKWWKMADDTKRNSVLNELATAFK
ncbi:small acid-soluble spore protein SspI [Psychrobacillus sp. FSL H8-0483]|uniref:small acid-soluble spore protein SspI n=1 Tax=Psychrobacillus sp. FSL H8-0483 TaxID=2921389 RepID=UPI00315A5A0F